METIYEITEGLAPILFVGGALQYVTDLLEWIIDDWVENSDQWKD